MDSKSSIKVIGVGLPRTGTASLQRALTMLGFSPCHHMQTDVLTDNFPYPKGRAWQQIFDTADASKRQAMIKSIFERGGFKATVDFPPSLFVDDLLEIYPNAKFILSVRKSPQAWRESFNATLDMTVTPWFYYATCLMPSQYMLLQPLARQWEELNARLYDGANIYRNDGVEVYERHNERIKNLVPKDRLLIHESSQGWAPMCSFLGVEVPKESYPHVNDKESIRKWFFQGAGIGVLIWCAWIAAAVGVAKLWSSRRIE